MESPTSADMIVSPAIVEGNSPKADVDFTSIAFGVMYQPRARIQRIDQFNCDTRHLREGSNEKLNDLSSHDHVVMPECDALSSLRLGFKEKSEPNQPFEHKTNQSP